MEDLLTHFTKSYTSKPDFKEGVVFLVDKPTGWTSFNVVSLIRNRLSRIEGVKRLKVGHAGTLDPLATGLLIICAGKYTKKIDSFQGMNKRYSGSITLGATRPSYDLETEIDEVFPTSHITKEMMYAEAKRWEGEIMQKPPMYSAISQGGERLYKKARRGEVVEIKLRKLTIDSFVLKSINDNVVDFILDCSKGTYVRSLAYDFGKGLESGAYLSSLRREKIGDFDVKNAWDLEELREELDNILEKVKADVS